ncbi:MAG TPA: FecR domain-containing protein [Methylocella sp.]|nr:FecR domain-containing protein [Methylocella sp.]
MTNEENASSPQRNPRDEAIGWWLRSKDRPLSSEDQRAFETWLARDPANKAAFGDISDMCEHFIGMRPRPAPPPSPAVRRFWLGGAAAFAATSLALFTYSREISVFLRSDYETGTGETKRLMLADGSHVELNAKSAIAVYYSGGQRRLTLLAGEALFEVTPDPARPFVVEAAGGTAAALGTSFDVALTTNAAHVTVTEHRVAVASGGGIVTVEEGQQTAYGDNSAPEPPSPANPDRITAWRRGKLIFENTPLGEVIEALGRYHHGQVYFVDSGLRERRVTAVFGTDDPVQAISEIETALGLHATYLTRYLIFLHH